MYGRTDRPISPRNGHTLVVGIVARISGCANQKEVSLDDQVDHGKQLVGEMYDGAAHAGNGNGNGSGGGGGVDYRVIATKGKGERLDRPELEEIRQELMKDELDLLVMEDLGRLVRGTEAVRLFGLAVDHGTRAVSPNDRVDTANSTWRRTPWPPAATTSPTMPTRRGGCSTSS